MSNFYCLSNPLLLTERPLNVEPERQFEDKDFSDKKRSPVSWTVAAVDAYGPIQNSELPLSSPAECV